MIMFMLKLILYISLDTVIIHIRKFVFVQLDSLLVDLIVTSNTKRLHFMMNTIFVFICSAFDNSFSTTLLSGPGHLLTLSLLGR